MSLCNYEDAYKYDRQIYEHLLNISNLSISEPILLFNCLKTSKLFLTSSYFESQIGLFYESSKCALKVDSKISSAYEERIDEIHHKMLYPIKATEETLVSENLSKSEIVNELEAVLDNIKSLTKKSKENVSLLAEIESWDDSGDAFSVRCARSSRATCASCCLGITDSEYFEFGCGHAFHRVCLSREVSRVATGDQKRDLSDLECAHQRDPSRSDVRERLDEVISRDCPACGIISTSFLSIPITDDAISSNSSNSSSGASGAWSLSL